MSITLSNWSTVIRTGEGESARDRLRAVNGRIVVALLDRSGREASSCGNGELSGEVRNDVGSRLEVEDVMPESI